MPQSTRPVSNSRIATTPPGYRNTNTPVGYHDNKAKVLLRLRKIEGQVRGLERMVDQDTYCIDVLTQISATTKALQAVALGLLDDHLAHCVADAARKGGKLGEKRIAEASEAIARLVKS